MPSRIIRDGWIESERINSLDPAAERFFLRLCLRADDFGRYHANPTLLKSNLFPLREDVRSTDMPRFLRDCEKAGLVRCYDDSGKRYVEVLRFGQRTRAQKSKFPPPPKDDGHLSDNCPADDGRPRTYSESETYSDAEAVATRPRGGLPESLNTPVFRERWLRWQTHWSDTFNHGKPMPEMTAYQQIEDLVKIGEERAITAINNSISKGTLKKPLEPLAPITNGAVPARESKVQRI